MRALLDGSPVRVLAVFLLLAFPIVLVGVYAVSVLFMFAYIAGGSHAPMSEGWSAYFDTVFDPRLFFTGVGSLVMFLVMLPRGILRKKCAACGWSGYRPVVPG